ncbi:hypothetical protein JR316_0000597 [Psilocybe cubensis]|uniref:Uncharacterized protein n=2 Tax=Psilocybe cubensis TaxID=181762 RepID=A0ACB8HFU4_PSICU|nr:hypothetical protein JR316_0000597 [Psilocybe cubensis]KAH9486532.1 hypothetical protein JR316_0000597 [Psilocybe cubensis]
MPSALPSADPAKQWWSISKSTSSKDLRQKYVQDGQSQRPAPQVKSSGKFTSFASAIGLKSKKPHPSLAIQDPPMTTNNNANVVSLPSPSPLSESTRPTSTAKSTSSTRSRVDSMPRTPVDSQRDHRHSLLTLSDTDPFAGRPMIAVPVPHLPSDPNRLSAYSNSSVTDLVQRKGDPPTFNRVSYASSSSNSHNHALDIPHMNSPISAKEKQEFRELHNKLVLSLSMSVSRAKCAFYRRSIPNIQTKSSIQLQTLGSLLPSTISRNRSGSSATTGNDSYLKNSVDGLTGPKRRARGMTDTAASHQAGFFVEEHSGARKMIQKSPTSNNGPFSLESSGVHERPVSPRVVIRQPSSSRLYHPPSAPPTHRLPPPPRPQSKDSTTRPSSPHSQMESPISSSMSFSSAISLTNDMFANPPFAYPDEDKRVSGRSIFSQMTYDELEISMFENEPRTAPNSPRTLKKALSQQSLSRRIHTSAPPTPKTPPESHTEKEKGTRKQRTFQHPRLPVPPIPLPSLASTSKSTPMPFPSSSDSVTSPTLERRRTSTASSTGRKRLFSHSSQNRPSTAQASSTADDDSFSLFSTRSDADSHSGPHKLWKTSAKSIPTSSFWEEGSSENMSSSPARPIEYTPQAIMSKADLAKFEASVESSPLKPARPRGFSVLSSTTNASDLDNDSEVIPIGLSPPPPPSRSNYAAKASGASAKKIPASPPIPQPFDFSVIPDDNFAQAPSSAVSQVTVIRPRSPALISLPPPPRRPRPTLITQPEVLEASRMRGPLSAKNMKAGSARTSTVEKAMHRRSIMRKASFLDIDDDTDQETEPEHVDEQINSSFLDLARESFDSTRTDS